jgi:hypothetical protein
MAVRAMQAWRQIVLVREFLLFPMRSRRKTLWWLKRGRNSRAKANCSRKRSRRASIAAPLCSAGSAQDHSASKRVGPRSG